MIKIQININKNQNQKCKETSLGLPTLNLGKKKVEMKVMFGGFEDWNGG